MPTAIQPADLERYKDLVSRLGSALEQNAPQQEQEAASKALGAHVQILQQQKIDPASFMRVEDDAVIQKAAARRLPGLPDTYVDSLSTFAAARIDRSDPKKGIETGSEIQKNVHAILDAKEMEAAKAAFDRPGAAVGIESSPEAQALYKALSMGGEPLKTAMAPYLEVYRKSDDPRMRGMAASFDELAAADDGARALVGQLESKAVVKDAMGILLGSPNLVSLPTNQAIRKAARDADMTPTEYRAKLREDVAKNLEKARPELEKQLAAGIAQNPGTPEADVMGILQKMMAGKPVTEEERKKLMANAAAAGAAGAAGTAAAGAAAEANAGVNAGANKGLTPELLAKLPQDTRTAIADLQQSRIQYHAFAQRNYTEMVGLIDSGLPIELIVMLVFMKLNERQEEKLKVKMKEVAAAEAMQRHLDSDVPSGEQKQAIGDAWGHLKISSLQTLMQELQAEQTKTRQMLDALSGIIRVIQDMASTPIRNIR